MAFVEVINKTLFITFNLPESKQAHDQECGLNSSGARWFWITIYGHIRARSERFHHSAFIMDLDFARDLKLLTAPDERFTGGYTERM